MTDAVFGETCSMKRRVKSPGASVMVLLAAKPFDSIFLGAEHDASLRLRKGA